MEATSGSIKLKLQCLAQNNHPFCVLDDNYTRSFEEDKDTSMFEDLTPNSLSNLANLNQSSFNSTTSTPTQSNTTGFLNHPSSPFQPQESISIPSSMGGFTLITQTSSHQNSESLFGNEIDINSLHTPLFTTPLNIPGSSSSQNFEGGNVGSGEGWVENRTSIASSTHPAPFTMNTPIIPSQNEPPIINSSHSISSSSIHHSTIPQRLVSFKGRKRGAEEMDSGALSSSSKARKKLQIKKKIISLKKEILDLELALIELE